MTAPHVAFEDDDVQLWCGRWQDVLPLLPPGQVDAVITDPPYSERTHRGSDAAMDAADAAYRRAIGYGWWSPLDVARFVEAASCGCRAWIVAMTDDTLAPVWRKAYRAAGRYDFASVSIIQHRVRLSGDGPSSSTIHLMVSRPRTVEFMGWGSLPGHYIFAPERASHVMGAKPLALMRALVRDYSRPGDLILDPCAGGATTLLAARLEGRQAIGIEMDPDTCAKAAALLKHGRIALKNPQQEMLAL